MNVKTINQLEETNNIDGFYGVACDETNETKKYKLPSLMGETNNSIKLDISDKILDLFYKNILVEGGANSNIYTYTQGPTDNIDKYVNNQWNVVPDKNIYVVSITPNLDDNRTGTITLSETLDAINDVQKFITIGYRENSVNQNSSNGELSFIIGFNNSEYGFNSLIGGENNTAYGFNSCVFGDSNINKGMTSFIEGAANTNDSSGMYSHMEGLNNMNSGVRSHIEGFNNVNKSSDSHVEGEQNENNRTGSHIEGNNNINHGVSSHIEGEQNVNHGDSSHIEGEQNVNHGKHSHIEGYKNTNNGNYSHVEGRLNAANGNNSHAEGYKTTANSTNSHAEGYGTITLNENEHACGMFNVSNTGETKDSQTIFSVGIGSSSKKKNAFEVRKNGDIYIFVNNKQYKLQDILTGAVTISTDTEN